MLQIEAVDIRPPEHSQVRRAGPAPPQPQALGNPRLAGQALDLDQHYRPTNRRQRTPTAFVRVVLALGMHARPGPYPHAAVLRVLFVVLRSGGPPAPLVRAGELRPVPSRAANRPVSQGRWIGIETAAAAQSHQHRHARAIQVTEFPRERFGIVAGVEHTQGHWARRGQLLQQRPDLRCRHGVGIGARRHAAHVQGRGPAIVGDAHLRQPGVRPAGHDRLAGGLARGGVIVASLGAGLGIVARPHAGIQSVDRLPIVQRVAGHEGAERWRTQAPRGQGRVEAAPAPPVQGGQAQVSERGDRPHAGGGVQGFKERVPPGSQARVHSRAERSQQVESCRIVHTGSYQLPATRISETGSVHLRG